MKVLRLTVLMLFCISPLFADTFVFKSGKRVTGVVLFEDAKTIRIRDNTGTLMSLRKDTLDQRATYRAPRLNTQAYPVFSAQEVTIRSEKKSIAQIAREARKGAPLRKVGLVTVPYKPSLDSEPLPKTEQDWQKRIRGEEQNLNRLSSECRSAGAMPAGNGVLKTSTYVVDGKKVRVTGYWAHPNHIEAAKRVCAKAIEAESRLDRIRSEFARFQARLAAK